MSSFLHIMIRHNVEKKTLLHGYNYFHLNVIILPMMKINTKHFYFIREKLEQMNETSPNNVSYHPFVFIKTSLERMVFFLLLDSLM